MIELDTAVAFLRPVLERNAIVKARGQSILKQILGTFHADGDDLRGLVVRRALALFLKLHHALSKDENADVAREVLYTSTNRRVVDGLLDLLSLEGIYPNLLPGVGVPIERRVQSVLQRGISTRVLGSNDSELDETLLADIVSQLSSIAMTTNKGLCSALRERTLVDLIAAQAQLAFAPAVNDHNQFHAVAFRTLIDSTLPSLLFPILTSLLHPATPEWLRPHVSTSLSLLPLRPDGVRITLTFLASTALPSTEHQEVSPGLAFPLEILNHAAKLLSSIPSTITADQYFALIAPQMLDLLDGEDIEMQRAAAYIIGNGILGKRLYGAPGKPGWDSFVTPIVKALMPDSPLQPAHSRHNTPRPVPTVVSSDDIRVAVSRLAALTLIHPNPGLVKRLVNPLFLSLWAITCCFPNSKKVPSVRGKAREILVMYLKVSAGSSGLILLTDHLFWDNGMRWNYVLDHINDLEIHGRSDKARPEIDTIEIMERIDSKVNAFVELLNDTATDAEVGIVFLHIARSWLLGSADVEPGSTTSSSNGSLNSLIYAKLTQEILQKHMDKLSNDPDKVLELVQEILKNFVRSAEELERHHHESHKVRMASLGSIVQAASIRKDAMTSQEESVELVSVSLGLLEALIDSMSLGSHSSSLNTLGSLNETLSALVRLGQTSQSVIVSARTISDQISRLMSHSIFPQPIAHAPSRPSSKHTLDLETRATALQNLSSPLPPVRAEGLSSLTNLIVAYSPVIDVPSTIILLLSLLQDDEEYIYLAVIKTLGQVAKKHQGTVTRMLMDRYVDSKEEGQLDIRLRTGEALRTTVSGLGLALNREITTLLGEGLITVAGRRGRRPKTAEEERKRNLTSEMEKVEAEKAWGGEVPRIIEDEDKEHESTAHLTEILSGWEGENEEEDVRIRVSALSILGIVMETNITGLGSALVSTSIDLAISILKIERSVQKAILRRAAALLLMSVVKGLENVAIQGRELGFDFIGESLADIAEVLRYLKDTEADMIVKGHIDEVIEGLEDWHTSRLIHIRDEGCGGIRFSLEGQLKGISASLNVDQREKPRIEELE